MDFPEEKKPKQHSEEKYPSRPGLLRLRQIVGDRDAPGLIPISRSSWWAGVKSGRFPKPLHLGPRTSVWRTQDIDRLIETAGDRERG